MEESSSLGYCILILGSPLLSKYTDQLSSQLAALADQIEQFPTPLFDRSQSLE